MTFDPQKFASDLGMSAEDSAALMGIYGRYPEAPKRFDAVFESEVSARMTPLQADLTKKEKDLDAQFETLSTVRGADSETIDKAHRDVEAARAALTVAQERIKRVATEAGLDPTPFLEGIAVTAPVTQPVVKTTVDSTMDANAILRQAGMNAWNALTSAADLQDIAQEHHVLFGKPMTNSRQLLDKLADRVKRTGNQNLTLRDVWSEEFKVEDKRNEIREADVTTRIKTAVDAARREEQDKAALGSTQNLMPASVLGSSPVMDAVRADKNANTQVRGLPEAVVASMADYRKRIAARVA